MYYLDYDTYKQRGGVLDSALFSKYNRKATMIINSQSMGLTGKRISKLETIPDVISDCVVELIDLLSSNDITKQKIKSESETQGEKSESVTYEITTTEQFNNEIDNVISDYFFGGGIGELLYRGVLDDD